MSLQEKLLKLNALKKLQNKTILVSGATGLIGKALVRELLNLNKSANLNLKLILVVRDYSKLDFYLNQYIDEGTIKVIIQDIVNPFTQEQLEIDYIIHTASVTSSKLMVETPVEVITTSIIGTLNLLHIALKSHIKSMVYLSSMEIYGFTKNEVLLSEKDIQYLNPLEIRSCYPESKRMCENLCVAYASEYGVPIKIARLAQTFGKGVEKQDSRVFAYFARKVLNNEDIVLMTNGQSKRMYVDIEDAVSAILIVLLKGDSGEAYNIANKETYCSIVEMANLVAHELTHDKIQVKFENDESGSKQFSPPHRLMLNTEKIESLGWKAENGLLDRRMDIRCQFPFHLHCIH